MREAFFEYFSKYIIVRHFRLIRSTSQVESFSCTICISVRLGMLHVLYKTRHSNVDMAANTRIGVPLLRNMMAEKLEHAISYSAKPAWQVFVSCLSVLHHIHIQCSSSSLPLFAWHIGLLSLVFNFQPLQTEFAQLKSLGGDLGICQLIKIHLRVCIAVQVISNRWNVCVSSSCPGRQWQTILIKAIHQSAGDTMWATITVAN